jgi:hypothetical protein
MGSIRRSERMVDYSYKGRGLGAGSRLALGNPSSMELAPFRRLGQRGRAEVTRAC